jgi:hypothetical protein
VTGVAPNRSWPNHLVFRYVFPGPQGSSAYQIHSTAEDIGIIYDIPVEPFGPINGALLGEHGSLVIEVEYGVYIGFLFNNYTASNYTVVSPLDLPFTQRNLRGLNLHLSRVEFETTAYIPTNMFPDGGPVETHFTFRLYGEDGAIPEPASILMVLVAGSLLPIRRRRVDLHRRDRSQACTGRCRK